MNHRQWKKKFKKVHGKNPNCWEDKRKEIRYDAQVMKDALIQMPKTIARVYGDFFEALSEGFATLSKAAKDASDYYRK